MGPAPMRWNEKGSLWRDSFGMPLTGKGMPISGCSLPSVLTGLPVYDSRSLALMRKLAGTALNVILVVTCIVTCFSTGRQLWISRERARNVGSFAPAEGTVLNLPGQDWTKSRSTVVMAIATSCGACRDSAPFHKRLVASAASAGVPVIALSPEPVEQTRVHLRSLGIEISDVRKAVLSEMGFKVMPTVVVVDQHGRVQQAWVGVVTGGQEKAIIGSMERR